MITVGFHAFKLTPFMGNELVCKLTIYHWNGDRWAFKSLEAVYFKDTQAKRDYITTLLRRFENEV